MYAKRTILDSFSRPINAFRTRRFELVEVTAGTEAAGAGTRETVGYFAASVVQPDGTRGGRKFETLEEARTIFESWKRK